jgi:hypothetical protein
MRDGRPRCFASFRHPSLLGTVGSSLLPIYIGMAFNKIDRLRSVFAIALCLLIVWGSNSGGPLQTTLFTLIGWAFWRFRAEMRKIRWMLVALLISLHLIMKAPVWYIFARLSSISGGDGWHRSYLIDVALEHIGDWWLMGMPISSTSSWFPYSLSVTGGADITNQYIGFGLDGGIGSIILFIVLLYCAYSTLGKALLVVRTNKRKMDHEFLLWGFGVMLSVHVVNWFGITYFDQTYMLWFMQIAALANISSSMLQGVPDSRMLQERSIEERTVMTARRA